MICAILKQKPYNFITNTLKAYLSTQTSSLSAFMISKTHIHVNGQKLRSRQLNAKVCGSESAFFLILSFFLLRPPCSTTISHKQFKCSPSFQHETDAYHSVEFYDHSASSQLQIHPGQLKPFTIHCPLLRTPFSNFVHMHTHKVSFPDQRPQSLVWK